MGMLNELYKCRIALGEEKSVNIKKEILQNNIYGVDIEKGAVDIARLRFWLALVVDETIPEPLPNLDFKIMQGNSLLESYQGVDLSLIGSEEEATDTAIDYGDEYISPKQQPLLNKAHKEKIQQLMKDFFSSTEDKNLKRKEINDLIEGQIHYKIIFEKNQVKKKIESFEKKFGITSQEDLIEKLQKGILTSKGKEYKAYMADKKRHLELDLIEKELISFQTKIERPYFLWHTYFGDVIKGANNLNNSGFDIVIGNPPYVNVEKIDSTIKNNINSFETAYKKYDLYILFYEKSLQLLKKGGVLSFITSNKFLSQEYGLILRKELLKNTIETIVNFNYDIFDNATVRTCILILNKQKPKYQHSIQLIDINSKKDTDKFVNRKYDIVFQNVFETTEYNNFRINLTEEKMSILDRIDKNCIRLEEICSVNYGLRPISLSGKEKTEFIKDNFFNGYKKYFEGKDTGGWIINSYRYLNYLKEDIYNPMFEELFENPKLAGLCTLSEINKLRFIYDEKNYYANHSVAILTLWHLFENVNNSTIKRNISAEKIQLSKEFDYKYLQGILNSKLIKFYVNELFYDGTHFYPNQMKALPIKKINGEQQKELISIVNQLHSELKDNIKSDVTLIENQIDILVYKLYNLTYEEVKVIDPNIESIISKKEYETKK